MSYTTLWTRLSLGQLNCAIQAFSIISIFFEGYDQGVMGGVNNSPTYVTKVHIGKPDGTVTNNTHQGGIVSVYYLGAIFGCFAGGWLGDRIELQLYDLCSRRLSFINNGYSDIRWRFLLAFQCIPALVLALFIKMLPDSPRYLASVGQREYLEIVTAAKHNTPSSPIQFAKILVGKGGPRGTNLGRRAWLCIWLQIMASWTGITAVTAYSAVLLHQAGYSTIKQNGLAGGINSIGILGTMISAQIIDRLGRRSCLIGGSAVLFLVNLVAGAVYEASINHPGKAAQYAPGAVTMLFLFNLGYAATWGTVAFLIPTEIFPSNLRAQGNGFGITGWAIDVGMTTLVNPIMFDSLQSRSYFLLAGLNLIWIPIVYLFYPETRNRSLESIEALFSTTSPFHWKMEQAYHLHGDVLAEHGVTKNTCQVDKADLSSDRAEAASAAV
ncbi:hypothetical protein N7492_005873 [Penicillium capsulatum]|uniref:Major facilitator superfamily (MFS) profile domain-containing protein n=1 Tax=Penicillium capsulatum TaxID=69766 RepID=A0A9W9IAG2_9EURO|nr:hypothetical protein N7492_005873 [Penicillium capsulatum]KAJ6135025.1 hypothetical protein N7512_000185 [Penicillium capsulatum]